MSTSTKTRRRQLPDFLDAATAEYAGGRSGRELWSARSTCGRWRVERVDDAGTPWVAEYLPTGQQVSAGNLDDLVAQAADPGTVERFRAEATRTLALGGRSAGIMHMVTVRGLPRRAEEPAALVSRRLGLAVRALNVIGGRVFDGDPIAWCACGAYLAVLDGRYVHADACRECRDLPGPQRCPSLAVLHTPCGDPHPVQCDHLRCTDLADIRAVCRKGRHFCCGCCDDR